MSNLSIPCCIMPTALAATAIIDTSAHPSNMRPGCLSVVGTMVAGEEIEIQRPLVSDPDPATDGDWTCIEQDDIQLILRLGHDMESIPVGIVIRVKKPATTNAVGVSWS